MTVEIRDRLALALDLPDLEQARRLARELQGRFGIAKVGLELFSAAGPDAIEALMDLGYDVFVDVKLHDIPTTVERAARVLGGWGARYLTIHAAGGVQMLEAGNQGLLAGAEEAGFPQPTVLAVTVLTSDGAAAAASVPDRVETALRAGCGGVVCAVAEASAVRTLGPDLTILTPGIRPAGAPTHDQQRVATPAEAVRAGADILVIGRAVTAADDPVAAAEIVHAELAGTST